MVPRLLVNTAWYTLPLSAPEAVKLYVVLVAPVISVQVWPLSVLTCHCTVGAGLPAAVAVKLAVAPTPTVVSAGWAEMLGALCTVRLTALVVVEPTVFVNTAWYCAPSSAVLVLKLYVVSVAPLMFDQVLAPLAFTCHCTVGAGLPTATALKVAVLPAVTVALIG